MEPNRLRFLISALFVLSLAGYNFLTYTSTTSEQSTFNLEPGLTANLVTTRTSSDVISGQFQENSGSPVSFYILSSAQFGLSRRRPHLTTFTALWMLRPEVSPIPSLCKTRMRSSSGTALASLIATKL